MSLLQQTLDYLFDNLELKVKVKPWRDSGKLPFYLKDAYDFFETKFMKFSCLLMLRKSREELSPGKVFKQQQQLRKQWQGNIVYVHHMISSHDRKRLIQQGISFIIPGKQMYIPELAMDLREHFRQSSSVIQYLSRATQALVLYFLVIAKKGYFRPSQLAKELGYTKMTLTRAFDELETFNILKISRKGKERSLSFSGDRKSLWERVKPFLRSPVKKKVLIKTKKGKMAIFSRVISGLSALAHFSSLNEEKLPTFAIDHKQFSEILRSSVCRVVKYPEEAELELELWHYDPLILSEKGVADPFSVYLSLQEEVDERVTSALEEMMEQVTLSIP
jgi:DNA-binding MarR family transcriptional regulator